MLSIVILARYMPAERFIAMLTAGLSATIQFAAGVLGFILPLVLLYLWVSTSISAAVLAILLFPLFKRPPPDRQDQDNQDPD